MKDNGSNSFSYSQSKGASERTTLPCFCSDVPDLPNLTYLKFEIQLIGAIHSIIVRLTPKKHQPHNQRESAPLHFSCQNNAHKHYQSCCFSIRAFNYCDETTSHFTFGTLTHSQAVSVCSFMYAAYHQNLHAEPKEFQHYLGTQISGQVQSNRDRFGRRFNGVMCDVSSPKNETACALLQKLEFWHISQLLALCHFYRLLSSSEHDL